MTHPSPSTIAKRAFYEAMKSGGESEAMWIAAADAVAEECAKVADAEVAASPFGNTFEVAANIVRARAALNKEPPCQET